MKENRYINIVVGKHSTIYDQLQFEKKFPIRWENRVIGHCTFVEKAEGKDKTSSIFTFLLDDNATANYEIIQELFHGSVSTVSMEAKK